jgi:hypothetical protein
MALDRSKLGGSKSQGGIMKNWKALAGVACLLAMAATAGAQMGMRQSPIPRGVFNPVVGSGAAYEITSSDGRKNNIEYAIVGKESVNGKDAYWMEWTTSGMGSGQMVMKVLTAVGDSTVTSRVIIQMPGRPPMEMPAQMTSRMNNQSVPADVRSAAEDVGSESITVPAGTFTCEHYRMKDGSGDTWVSTKVNPFGVVKHEGKDSTMVLTKVITDAKDKIVGIPQPFNPMMMMQQPPQ